VNRNSTTAHRLVILLSRAGSTVSSRQLEKWSQRGLLPLDWSSNAQVAAHFAVLVQVYRGGPRAADRAAIALACQGFSCGRLRDAIARVLDPGCSDAADLLARSRASTPALVDAQSDEGLAEIEAAVNWMTSDEVPKVLKPVIELLVGLFSPDGGAALPVIDPVTHWATGQAETPEQVAHSYLTNMVAAGVGDGIYDDTAIMALVGTDGDYPTLAMVEVLQDGGLYFEADEVLVGAPLQQLVVGVILGWAFASYVPHLSDDQRAIIAAGIAPSFIALFNRLIDSNPAAVSEMLGTFDFYAERELVTDSGTAHVAAAIAKERAVLNETIELAAF
jgi:hypothetical protein